LFALFKKYMKSALIFAILAPLSMGVEVFMDIRQPTLMSEIIDVGIPAGDVSLIVSLGKWMALYALIGLFGGIGCSTCSTLAATRFGSSVRQALFNKITTLSYKEIDEFTTSSLITRMTNDVAQVQQVVMMGLRALARAPFQCIFGLIASYRLSPRLALIFVAAIPILAIAVAVIIVKAFPLFSQVQKRVDRVNTVMRENLLGVKVVKAFVGQTREKQRFETTNSDLMSWSMRSAFLTITLTPISTFVLNASVIALFWFGGNMAIGGSIETGKIMALTTYLTQVLASIMQVMMILMVLSRAMASAERINAVLTTEPEIRDDLNPELPQSASVEFDRVNFRYNDSDPEYVLKDVSFAVNSGETVGIIGATGSGKSTLVALIPRLYDVGEGSVRIGGADVRKIPRKRLTRDVGVVLQESILFAGSIRENLRWADEECEFEVLEEAAQDAQAAEFIAAKPYGYDSPVEQRGKNFSGGQKQRLSIARTFARRPKILILDDSTSAVDTATEAKIREAIKRRGGGTTVFIIAQRISAIMRADRIIVLDEGRVSGIGSHAELLRSNEIYRAIAVSQLGEEVLEDG
jgi:ATP-binding cassette subfamily B protein